MTTRMREPSRRTVLGAGAALATAVAAPSVRAASAADFSGKSALVTGASSGFGRLTSLHLARNGATVIASMRNFKSGKRPEAQELADVAAKEKLKLSVVEIDVTNASLIASGSSRAHEIAGGALDLLVNNAGIGLGGPVEFQDEEAVFQQVNVNLLGYHRMARAVLPAMRKRRQGLIVNVSSQLGRLVLPNVGVYCATKFAVEAMFEAMAYELAPFGVEVAIVQPGGYPTKIWENGERYTGALIERADAERKEAYAAYIGTPRGSYPSDPMDVAHAIAEIFAAPVGKRPLRRPVSPSGPGAAPANAAMAEIQAAAMAQGRFKDMHAAVTD